MSKIGIITLNGYFNYGNRLQNYALQETLKSFGYDVETILVDKTRKKTNNSIESYLSKIKEKSIKEIYLLVLNKVQNNLNKTRIQLKLQREQIFKEFSQKYISETDFSISDSNIPQDLSDRYDFFVTGSDQVWNPYYTNGSPVEFLTFAEKEKRISYAASFGISEIPAQYKKNYSKWLSEIPFLSVREEEGAKIVKNLTGREANVHVDPTMLLTKEEWLSISKIPSNKPMKPYLLTYFLGKIPKERMNGIKQFAKRNNLEVVHLAQIRDKIPFLTGPDEFIDYINSSSVFFTDSFHGAVFSILLNKPFIVFNRLGNTPSMSSRLETLLKKFNLSDRFVENIELNSRIFEIDYSHTISILEEERKKALTYLENALLKN